MHVCPCMDFCDLQVLQSLYRDSGGCLVATIVAEGEFCEYITVKFVLVTNSARPVLCDLYLVFFKTRLNNTTQSSSVCVAIVASVLAVFCCLTLTFF